MKNRNPAFSLKVSFIVNNILIIVKDYAFLLLMTTVMKNVNKRAFFWCKSKIEKVPRYIQGEKSRKDTASSGKLVSIIGY